jgi:hypothetical protein
LRNAEVLRRVKYVIPGWAEVRLRLGERETQSLFLYYYLLIIVFICIICILIIIIIIIIIIVINKVSVIIINCMFFPYEYCKPTFTHPCRQ